MGAWGIHPMQNDDALDWIGDAIEIPIAEAIEKTLKAYLEESDEWIEEAQAEACVAVLIDLTSSATRWKYDTVNIRGEALSRKLWDLGIKVVNRLIKEDWWRGWGDEPGKLQLLKEMREELRKAKKEYRKIVEE